MAVHYSDADGDCPPGDRRDFSLCNELCLMKFHYQFAPALHTPRNLCVTKTPSVGATLFAREDS